MPKRKRKTTKARKPTRRAVRHAAPAPVAALPPIPPAIMPAPGAPVKKMKSIWYMVGLVLLTIGAVIFLTGIYNLIDPPVVTTAMGHLQPDLWWGGLMVVAGLIFVMTHRNSTVG